MGGIKGAALAYMIMAGIDAIIMFLVANKIFTISFESKFGTFSFIVMIVLLVFPFLTDILIIKLVLGFSVLLTYAIMLLNFFLSADEKTFLLSKLKMSIT